MNGSYWGTIESTSDGCADIPCFAGQRRRTMGIPETLLCRILVFIWLGPEFMLRHKGPQATRDLICLLIPTSRLVAHVDRLGVY